MARNKNKSILGDLRGKIGPVVLTESYGVPVARSLPSKPSKKKPRTGKRKTHTTSFGMVSSLLKSAVDSINLGFQQPKNPKMSAINAAVAWNFNHALSDDPENPVLELQKMKFSRPIKVTQKAWEVVLSVGEDDRVSIVWKLNPSPNKYTQLDDRPVILMYHDNGKRSRFICWENTAVRSDLNYTLSLDHWRKGHVAHFYLFMISADKKLVSDTQYLGMIKLKE